jgi:hypothetical protein
MASSNLLYLKECHFKQVQNRTKMEINVHFFHPAVPHFSSAPCAAAHHYKFFFFCKSANTRWSKRSLSFFNSLQQLLLHCFQADKKTLFVADVACSNWKLRTVAEPVFFLRAQQSQFCKKHSSTHINICCSLKQSSPYEEAMQRLFSTTQTHRMQKLQRAFSHAAACVA